jgi:hypothetical protein
VEKKTAKSPEFSPSKTTASALPGEIAAMKNCVCCISALATITGEVNVRFIALLNPFDRTQRPVCRGKNKSVK